MLTGAAADAASMERQNMNDRWMTWFGVLCVGALVGCADTKPPNNPCDLVECGAGTACVGGTCRPIDDGADDNNDGDDDDNNGGGPTNNGTGGGDNNGGGTNNGTGGGGTNNGTTANNGAGSNNGGGTNNGTNTNGGNNGTNGTNNGEMDAGVADADDMDAATDADGMDVSPEDTSPDTPPDVPPDVSEEDTGEDASCAQARSDAENTTLPVDIIWVVDTSGSMDQESDQVEDNLDDFARFIAGSGLDYHVVFIGSNSLCMPNPPSGGGCPDQDSDRYFHVRQSVGSTNALRLIVDTYPQYKHFLRPNAQVHMAVVTDDNSSMSANDFILATRNLPLDPGFPDLFTFHTIAAYGEDNFFGCCGWQGCGASPGTVYTSLSTRTGGEAFPICTNESEWAGIFDAIAENVIEGTVLPCEYDIPAPGPNQVIDPALINVFHVLGEEQTVIPNVDGPNLCAGAGWYYDNPINPTQVILCPDSCGFSQGRVEIEFGCATIKG